jgi:hypothetical protein
VVRSRCGGPGYRFLLITLRVTLTAHLLAALAQTIFAGQFLSGTDHYVVFHEIGGQFVAALGLAQILVIARYRVPHPDFVPFLVSSILILLAEALQIGTGYGRFLTVHIPLGVLICSGIAAQLARSLR